jgi:hypothetical protein
MGIVSEDLLTARARRAIRSSSLGHA